jgi:ankyrin repeat protein
MIPTPSARPVLVIMLFVSVLTACHHQAVETTSLHDRLVNAAQSGHLALVNSILAHGADKKSLNDAMFATIRNQPMIFSVDTNGNKIQTQAGNDPFTTIIGRLLEAGSDLNARDEEGATPLLVAAEFGCLGTVEMLLGRGADIEARDNDGNTPLIASACDCAEATMPDTFDVIKLLLEKGVNINARNTAGSTALMVASGGGVVKTDIVRLLIERGGELRIKNAEGQTALAIATKDGVSDVVSLLRNAAARKR